MLEVLCRLAGGAQERSESDGAIVLEAHVPVRRGQQVVRALRARAQALRRAGVSSKGTRCYCRVLSAQRWEDAWRKGWGPQRFQGGLVVLPSWAQHHADPGEKILVLDPGLAFGRGQHPTTRMCLNALGRLVRPGDRVADVGCGSGILALAAARLGARRVWAIDNDPQALQVARKNVRRNRLSRQVSVRQGNLLQGARGEFDLIVANIAADEVTRMAHCAADHLDNAGVLVASGIARGRVRPVVLSLAAAGLQTTRVLRDGAWVGVVCRKRQRAVGAGSRTVAIAASARRRPEPRSPAGGRLREQPRPVKVSG